LAAMNGQEAVVKLLLERGADIDSDGKYSQTPLSLAARNGHEVVVKLLLERGADVNSYDMYSQAPRKPLLVVVNDPGQLRLYAETPI
jgi:ankyrin repeat protein